MMYHLSEFPSFWRLNNIPCICHILLIQPSVSGRLGCFPISAIVNNDGCKNNSLKPCFLLGIYSEGQLPDHDIFIFNILRNCYTVFHGSCIILHSHEQCINVPVSPRPYQLFLFSDFFDSSHPYGYEEVYLIEVLICSFLMISDVEYLFKCLLASYYLLWRNIYLNPCPFLNQAVQVLIIEFFKVLYIFLILTLLQIYDVYLYFLPFHELPFYSVDSILGCTNF